MNLLLGVALVLGLMIMIHEWGHFIVARFLGVLHRLRTAAVWMETRSNGLPRERAAVWRLRAHGRTRFVRS